MLALPVGAPASSRLDLPVFVTAGTYMLDTTDSTVRHEALSAFIEFRYRSPARLWSASMFVDYMISRDVADLLKAGALFRYGNGHWDGLAGLFRFRPRGGSTGWGYKSRVRYRLAERHKVGVESFGRPGQIDNSYLMFGYYGDVSADLSVHLVAGANVGNRRDRTARIEVIWQVN